jgi:hypothetical protein
MKLGELLIQNGFLTPDQLEKALDAQQLYGGKLGTNLVELGLVSETVLAGFLAEQLHMEAAGPEEFETIPDEILKLVPRDVLKEHRMIPLKLGQKLRVAISDPHDLSAIDQLGFQIGKPIQTVIAPEIWIVAALERHYHIARPVRYIAVDGTSEIGNFEVTHDMTADPRKMAAKPAEPVRAEKISLEAYGQKLLAAQTSSEVFNALMDYLGPITPRMAIYVVRKDHVGGYMLRGFPVHDRQFAEAKVEFGAQSVICRVVETLTVFQGSYQSSPDEEKVFGALRLAPGTKIELHPIPAFGKTVAAFLGLLSPDHSFTKPDAGRLITLICEKAGLALEILNNRRKILKNLAA